MSCSVSDNVASAERPGKPSSASLTAPTSCSLGACIVVNWNFPRVPFHGLYCGGGGPSSLAPRDCPLTMGRSVEADGGSEISRYLVQWSTVADFSITETPDFGEASITEADIAGGEPFSYTITDLNDGQDYYVRIMASNSAGLSKAQDREGLTGDGAVLMRAAST